MARTDDEEETADALTIAFPVCIGEITVAAEELVVAGEPVAGAKDNLAVVTEEENVDELDQERSKYALMAIPCTILRLDSVVVR